MTFDDMTQVWEVTCWKMHIYLSLLPFFQSPAELLISHPNQKPMARDPVGVVHISCLLRKKAGQRRVTRVSGRLKGKYLV